MSCDVVGALLQLCLGGDVPAGLPFSAAGARRRVIDEGRRASARWTVLLARNVVNASAREHASVRQLEPRGDRFVLRLQRRFLGVELAEQALEIVRAHGRLSRHRRRRIRRAHAARGDSLDERIGARLTRREAAGDEDPLRSPSPSRRARAKAASDPHHLAQADERRGRAERAAERDHAERDCATAGTRA